VLAIAGFSSIRKKFVSVSIRRLEVLHSRGPDNLSYRYRLPRLLYGLSTPPGPDNCSGSKTISETAQWLAGFRRKSRMNAYWHENTSTNPPPPADTGEAAEPAARVITVPAATLLDAVAEFELPAVEPVEKLRIGV
jgi:hypothetical protein